MTPGCSQTDGTARYLKQALEVARGGLGWVSPNPLVGCVIVRDGGVIGTGFHGRYGDIHAEVAALRDAGDARGATAYVTLEPCTHHGKQPPCCEALIAAGVKRVVWGMEDPNPVTGGKAQAVLEAAGIVAENAHDGRCEEFLDYFATACSDNRPFIHLKLALSLDGKAACPSGHSQWFSGPEALGYAHYLRLKYDAVMISARTAIHDNARLSVRTDALENHLPDHTAKLRQPVRVILDLRFETLAMQDQLALFEAGGDFRDNMPMAVIAGEAGRMPDPAGYPEGVRLIGLSEKTNTGQLRFYELASRLWDLNIRSVLVEGGGGLSAELIRQHAVDKMTMVYTKTIVGADGRGFTPPLGNERVTHCPRLTPHRAFVLGDDAVLEGYPVWGITGS